MRLAELAQRLESELGPVSLRGDADVELCRVADLRHAQTGDIAFIADIAYLDALSGSNASALLLKDEHVGHWAGNALIVADPYLAYALVAQWLDPTPKPAAGVHATAVIAPSASIAADAHIGAHVVIAEDAHIGAGAVIGAGCCIGERSVIGAGTRLWPQVSVYHDVRIGARCTVHSGSVLGSDGFGYAQKRHADGVKHWVRIPQTGGVVIGDDVDIGANCAIDRGALNDTVIGNGVKLDNFIHIAHNVEIGAHSAAAAMTGIAGSTKIGQQVTLAGRVSVIGHLDICAGSHITACSTVTKSITEPGVYSSGTTLQPNREWRKSVARFFQLDDVFRRVRDLEKQQEKRLPPKMEEK